MFIGMEVSEGDIVAVIQADGRLSYSLPGLVINSDYTIEVLRFNRENNGI